MKKRVAQFDLKPLSGYIYAQILTKLGSFNGSSQISEKKN